MKFYYSGVLVKNKINPIHRTRIENLSSAKGKKRSYKWTSQNKRIVRSRASFLAYMGRYNYFITLTYPVVIDDNRIMKLFLDNLKKRGYVESFIWVKERGSKGGRLHYHLLFNSSRSLWGASKRIAKCDFVADTKVFQDAWNTALVGVGSCGSDCSVRLGRTPVIKKNNRVGYYITKYITKDLGEFESRNYGCSYDLKENETLVNNDKVNKLSFVPYRIIENDYVVNEYFSLSLELINEVKELGKIHTVLSSQFLDHTGSEAPGELKKKEHCES